MHIDKQDIPTKKFSIYFDTLDIVFASCYICGLIVQTTSTISSTGSVFSYPARNVKSCQ